MSNRDEPSEPIGRPRLVGAVQTGPNHALHGILTLLTFWACGGWVWVWLFIALFGRRRVHVIDEYGRVVSAPTPERGPTVVDRIDKWLSDENGNIDAVKMTIIVGVAVAVIVIVAAVL